VTQRAKDSGTLKVVIQSLETKLFLTRAGHWCTRGCGEMLLMDPVEAIGLCLRLGVRHVKFTSRSPETGIEVAVYPFGGDPTVRAYRKQLRKTLSEQRRMRSERRTMEARIKVIEDTRLAALGA
jgi:hypothetical protein